MRAVIVVPILFVVAIGAVGAAAAMVAAQSAAPVTLDALLARAGAYVTEFEVRFSNVVAEEHYEQLAPAATRSSTTSPNFVRRELRSDFLLVKLPDVDSWMPFRDVFEVDGKPVRDRQERLTGLFLQPQAIAVDQAKKIADESSRYNIGNILRTINVPVLALVVLR